MFFNNFQNLKELILVTVFYYITVYITYTNNCVLLTVIRPILIFRGNFDKLKADIRLMKEELLAIERYRTPKERSLAQCSSNLEAMQTTRAGLESELHQVFLIIFYVILL